MQITRVEAIALTTPYGTPGAQTRERSAVFVEVEVADGTVGVGETYLGVYMPELAIECALWDILGKRLGVPVHTLLGGAVHDRIPLYTSGGVLTFTRDQLVSHTKEVVREGYLGFKMRANPIAYQPAVEAERVAAVREALKITDGYLLPPTAPGLGVVLTAEVKAKYPYRRSSASLFG